MACSNLRRRSALSAASVLGVSLVVLLVGTVNRVSCAAPVFSEDTYYRARDENITINTLIVRVFAEDADGDAITYSIVNTTSNNFIPGSRVFSMNPTTGELRLQAHMDRETSDWYQMFVSASDGTNTAYASVYVLVGDIDDNKPRLVALEPSLTFHEDELPVDVSRNMRLKDADTILYQIHGLRVTTRTYDLFHYPLAYGFCSDNATQDAFEVCAVSPATAITVFTDWTTGSGTPVVAATDNKVVSLTDQQYAFVNVSALLPLGHSFTISAWILQRDSGGGGFQYFFVHANAADSGIRYQALAALRGSNQILFTYHSAESGEGRPVYVYFDLGANDLLAADNEWHFIVLTVSLDGSAPVSPTSIQLKFDDFFFSQPTRIRYSSTTPSTLPPPVADPSSGTIAQVGGRPGSTAHHFVGMVSQLAFWKSKLATAAERDCLLSCGDVLSFSLGVLPFGITSVVFTRRTRELNIVGSAPAGQMEEFLNSVQFSTSERPPTSRVLDIAVTDTQQTSDNATIELLYDNVPRSYRPSIDLNGQNRPGIYYETEWIEGESGSIPVASDVATSLPVVKAGEIPNLVIYITEFNVTIVTVTNDNEGLVVAMQLPAGITMAGASTRSLRMTGTASNTIEQWTSIAQAIRYQNLEEEPTAGVRKIQFSLSNNNPYTNRPVSISSVTVTKTNDAPFVDLNSTAAGNDIMLRAVDLGGPINVLTELLVTDSDSMTLEQAEINFTPLDGKFERLLLDDAAVSSSKIERVDRADGSGRLYLVGEDSIAEYVRVLSTLRWQHTETDRNTTTGFRNLTLNVYDNFGRASVTRTAAIFFLGFDDPPVIELNDPHANYSTSYTEETAAVQLIPDTVNITDPDSYIQYAVVQLTNPGTVDPSTEVLDLMQNLPVGLLFDIDTGLARVTISGKDSTDAYQRALRQITYRSNLSEPDSSFVRNFDVWVVDTTNVSSKMSSSVSVSVTVISLNDNGPIFNSACNVSVVENFPLGNQVLQVDASDADFGSDGILLFTATDVRPQNEFSLNSSNGWVLLDGTLDYEGIEQYWIDVNVSDGGTVSRSNAITCRINVLDVNDNRPVVDLDALELTTNNYMTTFVERNESIALVSNNVVLYDVDSVTPLIHWVVVNLTNGGDWPNEYLRAGDISGLGLQLTGNGTLLLNFSGPASNASFSTALETLMYVHNLSNPGNPSEHVRLVEFTASDGELSSIASTSYITFIPVNDVPVLDMNGDGPGRDYQTRYIDNDGSYQLRITSGLGILDVDNFYMKSASLWLSGFDNSLVEVLIVTETDADITVSGNYTQNLTLSGRATEIQYKTVINSIRYLYTQDEPEQGSRLVTLTITDSGHRDNESLPSLTSLPVTTTIDVVLDNDHRPVFQNTPYTVTVREDADTGLIPLVITATDLDEGIMEYITYTIIDSGTDPTGVWSLDADTGNITLVANRTAGSIPEQDPGPLDYELQRVYEFVVEASDNSNATMPGTRLTPHTTNITVQIWIEDLNDNTPVFVPNLNDVSRAVDEDVPLSFIVYDFNATDKDDTSNGNLSYWIVPGQSWSSDRRLYLNPITGQLSVGQALDREDVASYWFQVVVRDAGVPSRTDLVNVSVTLNDVNDVPPVFDPDTYNVLLAEDTVASTLQLPSFLSTEASARWRPHLASGTYSRQLVIESEINSGNSILLCDMLTVTNTSVMLKEEVVMPRTTEEKCFSAGRKIIFEQMTELVPLNNPWLPNPLLARLTVSDSTKAVDWLGIYDVTITAQHKPYSELYTYFRNETLMVQQRIAKASGTYAAALDGTAMGGAFSCPLRTGNWSSGQMVAVRNDITKCSSNFTTGNLGATWDSAMLAAYVGSNEACLYLHGLHDQLDPPLNARVDANTVGLKVFVSHTCGDNNTCLQNSYDVSRCGASSLPRGMAFSQARAPLEAYDRDIGLNGELIYSIQSGDDYGLFTINSSSGVLELVKEADYENTTLHTLVIEARDSSPYFPEGLSYRSDTATVSISVLDVNDNRPEFSATPYSVDIDENTLVGTTVLSITATDSDATTNGFLTYSITAASHQWPSGASSMEPLDNTTFRLVIVNASTTQVAHVVVWHQANLDYEQYRQFEYTITVSDHGWPTLSATASLVIQLRDLNDNLPLFRAENEAPFHLEDEAGQIATRVFQSVNISDADTVPNAIPMIHGVRITSVTRGNYTASEEFIGITFDPVMYPALCVDNRGREILIEGGMPHPQYENLLKSLLYENTAEEFLYNDTAVITVWITDEPSTTAAGMNSCSFQFDRNFTSLVHELPLQERNDRPEYTGPSSLPDLPTVDEDPLHHLHLGRPAWQLFDSLVQDNDDIDNNAVFGLAVTDVTGNMSGYFEYSMSQVYTGELWHAGVSWGWAVATIHWDSSVELTLQITQTSPMLIDRVDFGLGASYIGRVRWTGGDGNTTFSGWFDPFPGDRIQLLRGLEGGRVAVHVWSQGSVFSNTTLSLQLPLTWKQISPNSSFIMAGLVGSGSRFRFQPAMHANGEKTASLLAWDQRDGGVYVGTNAYDTTASTSVTLNGTTISSTVNAVNDPPYIRLDGLDSINFTTTFVENIVPVPIVDQFRLTIDDVEDDSIVSVLMNIYGENSTVCNSTQECPGFERTTPNLDRILFSPNDLFDLGVFNVTGTICKTWNITTFHTDPNERGTTESNWQQYLRSAQFFNQHPEPYDHVRTIEFRGFDGMEYGPPAYAFVNIFTFNDNEPRVTSSAALQFVEAAPCNAIGLGLSVVDPDCAARIQWARITLESEADGGYLRLNATANTTHGLEVIYGNNSIYVNGSSTVTQYQEVLRSLSYFNNADEPSAASRTLTFQVRGRVAESETYRFAMEPRLISDNAPELYLAGAITNATSAQFVEDSPLPVALVLPSGIRIVDNDTVSHVIYSVTLSVSDLQDGAHEIISLPSPTTLGVQEDSVRILNNNSSSVTLTSLSASLQEFITLLEAATYLNTAAQPQGGSSITTRTILYAMEDKENLTGLPADTPCGVNPLVASPPSFTTSAVSVVTILPTNDLPEVRLDASINRTTDQLQINFDEGGPPVALTAVAGGTIIDIDNDTLDYLEVRLTGVRDGVDEAILADLTGTTFNVTVNDTNVVRFTGPESRANFILLLNSLRYNNKRTPQPTNGTRDLTIVVSDGFGESGPANLTIAVDIFNNAPLIDLNGADLGRSHSVNFTEGGSNVYLAPAGSIIDSDSENLKRMEVLLTGIEVVRQETLIYDMSAVRGGINCDAGCSPESPNVITLRAVFMHSTGANISIWQALMRTFRYQNRDDELNGTRRIVIFNVTDDKEKSAQEATTVNFIAVPDTPRLDLDIETPGTDFVVPNVDGSRLLENAPEGSGISIVNLLTAAQIITAIGEAATVATTTMPTAAPGNVTFPPPLPPPSPPANLINVTTVAPTTPAQTTMATTPAQTTMATTPAPTTMATTQGQTTMATTPAPTTMATTQAQTTMATTQAPTTMGTTQAPTTMATTQAQTTMATTQAPTTMATTPAPTTMATTQAQTTMATTPAQTTMATTPTMPASIATTIFVPPSPPDQGGRRKRQAPQAPLGEAGLDVTTANLATTLAPSTAAAVTTSPVTQEDPATPATGPVDPVTTIAARVPVTFQQTTTALGFGVRGFSLTDSDSLSLDELLVAVEGDAMEDFDIDGATRTDTNTVSVPSPPSLFGDALNQTFSGSVSVRSVSHLDTSLGLIISRRYSLGRRTDGGAYDTVFSFVISGNATVREYEDLLGKLRYRNTADEPCCSVSATDPTVIRTIRVFATDDGTRSSNVATSTVSLNLQNDNAPVFPVRQVDIEIPENATAGSPLHRVIASDADVFPGHSTITYAIINSQLFNVTKTSDGFAELSLGGTINRELFANHLLNLTASDGEKFDFMLINVTVLDNNDNTPIFSNVSATVNVSENVVNALVTTFTVKDADSGRNGQVMVTILDPPLAPFEVITSPTGVTELRVASGSVLNRETRPEWSLTIRANDLSLTNARSSSTVINVTVIDVNDNAPMFSVNFAALDLAEDAPVGPVPLYTVQASDQDVGSNAVVEYYLGPGASSSRFSVDQTTGVITLTSSLDYENATWHAVIVEARNPGPSANLTWQQFRLNVTVLDTNDNSPRFLQQPSYEFVTTENSESAFGVVEAVDADSHNVISYSIDPTSGTGHHLVRVNTTGYLSVRPGSVLDRETTPSFTFYVVATDSAPLARRTSVLVNVTLTDVNDNPPTFVGQPYAVEVNESDSDTFQNTSIFTVLAQDRDAGVNAEVRYTLLTFTHLFDVDPSTGTVMSIAQLDYDPPALMRSFMLQIVAEDQAQSDSLNSTTSLLVTVADVNDNAPIFPQAMYAASVSENALNASVIPMPASDIDSSSNGRLHYTVVSNDGFSNSFRMPDTGELFTAMALDREEKEVHVLSVTAYDRGVPQRSAQVTVIITVIDVNDGVPYFVSTPFNFFVPENTPPGTEVAVLQAIDNDTAIFSDLSYSIAGGAGVFAIDSVSGNLTVLQTVDYEGVGAKLSYTLALNATDGQNVGSETIFIQISDEDDFSPEILNLPATINISETVSVPFFSVRGRDLDGTAQFNTFNFSLVNNSVEFPDAFRVLPNGDVERALPVSASRDPLTTIGVQACGGSGLCSDIEQLTIRINRGPAVQNRYMFTVHENTEQFFPVGTVTATDPNCGSQSVQGCLLFQITDGNQGGHFEIDNLGQITTTSTRINREQTNMINLTVSVSDTGVGASTVFTTVLIGILDRNDVQPCFAQSLYMLSAVENVDNLLVALLQTMDTDLGNNSLISAELLGTRSDHFYSEHYANGSVAIFTNHSLDREMYTEYNIIVRATDMGTVPLNCTASLTISVEDVNDNCPQFSIGNNSAPVVNEFAPLGFEALKFTVSDADAGTNAALTVVTVADALTASAFRLNLNQDALLVNRKLDPESALNLPRQYSLVLRATDGSTTNPCSTLHYVTISVSDENDNCPMAANTTSTLVIEEDASIQDVVTVYFTDPDFGPNGLLNYSLNPLSEGYAQFRINSTTAAITSVGKFDRETKSTYTLLVDATDNPVNFSLHCRGHAFVTVLIQDVNDNNPAFDRDNYTFSVEENAADLTFVGSVSASDRDINENADLDFNITSTDGTPVFFTISKSGEIRVGRSGLDREAYPFGLNYTLLVIDNGTPKRQGAAHLTVFLTDINDNIPELFGQIRFSFLETADVGTTLFVLNATDKDIGINAEVRYVLRRYDVVNAGPDPGQLFAVDGETGRVTLNNTVDFESRILNSISYEIQFQVHDKGSPALFSQSPYIVNVLNDNDNPPVFASPLIDINLREDAPNGTFLAKFNTTDADMRSDDVVIYRFVSAVGNAGGADNGYSGFHFPSATIGELVLGGLSTGQDLDYEKSTVVTVTVSANDGRNTAFATLVLNLIDANDNAPHQERSIGIYEIYENVPIGTIVNPAAPWIVTDADRTAPNNEFDLSLVELQADFFNITNDGYISTAVVLDSEFLLPNRFKVRAEDRGTPSLVTITLRSIYVYAYDRNDNPPIFDMPDYTVRVLENASVGTLLLQFHATDADTALNNIVFTDNETTFHTNTTAGPDHGLANGYVWLASGLDRETRDVYRFNITAVNGPVNAIPRYANADVLYTNALLTVQVGDIDDNRPSFLRTTPSTVTYTEQAGAVSLANESVLQDPDILSEYPVSQLRVVLQTAGQMSYPAYGFHCSQELFSGAGPAVTMPYTNSFDICNVADSTALLPLSSVCGQRSVAHTFDLYLIQDGVVPTFAPQTDERLEMQGDSLLAVAFKTATNGTLLSRYTGEDNDLSLQVSVTSTGDLAVTVGYDNYTDTDLVYSGPTIMDDRWHHLMMYIRQVNSFSLSVYIDGTEVFSDASPGAAAPLLGMVKDNATTLLVFGGEYNCSDATDNAEIAEAFLSNRVADAAAAAAPCCTASCGNMLSYDRSLSDVSVLENCAERSLLFQALPGLSDANSVNYFNSVLGSVSYNSVATEVLEVTQTVKISASDTVGFGDEHVLVLTSAAVNDWAPEIYLTDSATRDRTVSFTEDILVPVGLVSQTGSSIIDRDTVVSAVSYINVTISNPGTYANNLERLVIDPAQVPASLIATMDASMKSVKFTSQSGTTASYSDFLAAIRLVRYLNEEDEPNFARRTITFEISDGVHVNSPQASAFVNVIEVNDAPVFNYNAAIIGPNYNLQFREGDVSVQVVPANATLTDSDNTTLVEARVVLTSADARDMLILGAAPSAIISNDGFESLGVGLGGAIIFQGEAPLADYLAELKKVRYSNTDRNPPSIPREITLQVEDGIDRSVPEIVTVNLDAVNNVPLVDLNGAGTVGFDYLTTFTEEGPCVPLVDNSSVITDPDSATLEELLFDLPIRSDGFGESVHLDPGFVLPAGLSVAFTRNDSSAMTMRVFGTATLGNYTLVLRSVVYCNSRDEPNPATRSISVLTRDSMNANSSARTASVAIQLTNDAPVLQVTGMPVFIDSSGSERLFSTAIIIDPDSDSMTSIEIRLQTLRQSGEFFSSTIATLNSSIQEQIVTPERYRLNFGLPVVATQDLILDLDYTNLNDEPTPEDRVICITVSDLTLSSTEVCITLGIQFVNDHSPTIVAVVPDHQLIPETTTAGELMSSLAATDGDYGSDGMLTYSIQSVQSQDTSTGSYVDTTAALLFSIADAVDGNASVRLAQALDMEQYVRHNITVLVSDGASPPRTADTLVVVSLSDVNDHEPQFTQAVYTVSVPETLGVDDPVLSVSATDADATVENRVSSYALLNATDLFKISDTGEISLRALIDRTLQAQHTLAVQVQDGQVGKPLRFNSTAIAVVNILEPSSPLFTNTTTSVWIEGTRSQTLSPSVTIGGRSRLTTVTSATVHLPVTTSSSCPSLNICQLDRLRSCEVQTSADTGSQLYHLMETARNMNRWTNRELPPTDAACQQTGAQLTQNSYTGGAYATLPNNALPDLSQGNFTIASRFRLLPGTGQAENLLAVTVTNKRRYLAVYFENRDSARQFVFYNYDPVAASFVTTKFNNVNVFDGQFHHLTLLVSNDAQFGNGKLWLYIDCQFHSEALLAKKIVWDTGANVHIGKRDYPSATRTTFNYDGVVDDITVHTKLWSQEEINCVCSDNSVADTCGETLERPQNTEGLTATLSDFGKSVSFAGTSTFDTYERVLRSVAYRYIAPISQDVTRSATFGVTVSDNGFFTGATTTSIAIQDTNTNLNPTILLDGTSSTINYLYDEALHTDAPIASGVVLDDLDNSHFSSARVYLSSHAAGETLRIDAGATTGIVATSSTDNTSIDLSSAAGGQPLQNFQAILRTVLYKIDDNTPSASLSMLTYVHFEVTDIGKSGVAATSASAVVTITIQPAGNRAAPAIGGLASPLTVSPLSTPIAGQAVVSDIDVSKEARSILVQLGTRPAPVVSSITGQSCERYAPLLTRTLECAAQPSVYNLFNPEPTSPALNSPVTVDTSRHDGNVGVFDGINFHLIVPTANHDLTSADITAFTVSAWYNQAAGNEGYILALTTDTTERVIVLYVRGDLNIVWVQAGLGTNNIVFDNIAGLGTGVWQHILATSDGQQVTLYVDGVLQGAKPVTAAAGQTPSFIVPANYRLYLGARPNQFNPEQSVFKFSGQIAGLHLWLSTAPASVGACIKQCRPSLQAVASDGISLNYDESSLSLRMSGLNTTLFTSYQTALRTLQYTNELPVSGTRSLTYTITDEVGLSSSTTQDLTTV